MLKKILTHHTTARVLLRVWDPRPWLALLMALLDVSPIWADTSVSCTETFSNVLPNDGLSVTSTGTSIGNPYLLILGGNIIMESTTDGTSGLAAATPIPARLTVSNNTSPLQTSTIAQSLLLMQQSTGSTLANVFDVRYTGKTTGSSGTQVTYSITVGATPLSTSTYPLIQLASKTTTLQNTLTVHGKSQFNGDVFITAPVPTPTPSVGLRISVGQYYKDDYVNFRLTANGPAGSTPLLQATSSTGSQLLTVYGNPTVYIGPSPSPTVSSGATLYVNLQGQSAFFNGPVMLSPWGTLPFTCTANTEGAIALRSDYALCTCFSGSWHKASDPSTPCWN
jgi:hypothetical protein